MEGPNNCLTIFSWWSFWWRLGTSNITKMFSTNLLILSKLFPPPIVLNSRLSSCCVIRGLGRARWGRWQQCLLGLTRRPGIGSTRCGPRHFQFDLESGALHHRDDLAVGEFGDIFIVDFDQFIVHCKFPTTICRTVGDDTTWRRRREISENSTWTIVRSLEG